jgi:hypothetical protein
LRLSRHCGCCTSARSARSDYRTQLWSCRTADTLGGRPRRLAIIANMPASHGTNRDASVLEGALERITYANPETGYTIARIDAGRGPDLITAVGPLLGA